MKKANLLCVTFFGACLLVLAPAAGRAATVSTFDGLRSTPSTTGSGYVHVSGYATLEDGGQGDFYWDQNSTAAPNGGTVVQIDTPSTINPGRWVRQVEDPATLNVAWFGAFPNGVDCITNINNAIKALPNGDYSTVQSPGAGGSGHIKMGALFFPSPKENLGTNIYTVSDTVYCSSGMSLIGSDQGFKPCLGFQPGVAPSETSEKFVVQFLLTPGDANASSNTTFFTQIKHLRVFAGNNPGASGIYFAAANMGVVQSVYIQAALRGIVVDSSGCSVDDIGIDSVQRGPGITFLGGHIHAGHLDPEHVFSKNASGTLINDADGYPYPALQVNAADVSIAQVMCEQSPLMAKVNGGSTIINSLYGNVCGDGLIVQTDQAVSVDAVYNVQGNANVMVTTGTAIRDTRMTPNLLLDWGSAYHKPQLGQKQYFTALAGDGSGLKNLPGPVAAHTSDMAGHKRLVVSATTPYTASDNFGTYLVTMGARAVAIPNSQASYAAIVTVFKRYSDPFYVSVTKLSGKGISWSIGTNTSTNLELEFGVIQAQAANTPICVTRLDQGLIYFPLVFSVIDEPNAAVNNGTAAETPNL